MIITRTPFRMSFFGGGTDMPEYFDHHPGAVLSTSIDKYCYCIVRHLPRFFDYSSEIVYSRIERVAGVEDIEHPAVREAMRMLDMHEIRLSYEADLPARSGLGTSSSFAVGMLQAFYALKGKYADQRKLADEAIYLERTLCNEAGGWQDQIAAAYGGFNRIDFYKGSYEVRPVIMDIGRRRALEERLMMFFTGFTRFSSEVQRANLSEDPMRREELLSGMYGLVTEAESVLTDKHRDLADFGRLLDQSWRLKRLSGPAVTSSEIDAIYELGLAAGALGGKLMGAGGGGFILFYVEPERRGAVAEAMGELLEVPFGFEETGSRVIHFEPEEFVPISS